MRGYSLGNPFLPAHSTIYITYILHTTTQYQSRALVIRYNRAVLEPSGDFQVDDGTEAGSAGGFPWWGILIIVVGALVLVAALSVVIMVSQVCS